MSRHRSQSFSKLSQTQQREKAERYGGSGGVGQAQGVIYEPLIFRSLLSTRWRFSSTPGLKSTSQELQPKTRSPRERGEQGQEQGLTLRENASTSRLSAAAPPPIPLRTSSRSHSRVQAGVPGDVPASGKVATPEQSGTGARRRKDSMPTKARPKESSVPSIESASSLKASQLAKQKLKPSSSSNRPERASPAARAGATTEDEPKIETPKLARADSVEVDQKKLRPLQQAEPSLTTQPPGTAKSPSSAEARAPADPTPEPSGSEQTKPPGGVVSSVTPSKSLPAKCPEGAETSPHESPAATRPPAKAEDSATEGPLVMSETAAGLHSARQARHIATDHSEQQQQKTATGAGSPILQSLAISRPRSHSAPPRVSMPTPQSREPEGTLSTSESPATSKPRAQSAPPDSRDPAERKPRHRKPNGLYYNRDVTIEAHASKKVYPSAKAAAAKPRPPSALPATVRSIAKKPKGAKRVRFGVETTHKIEVDPGRHLRPLSSANFGTRSGLSYLGASADPKKADKAVVKVVVKFPEGKIGTKLRRRRQRQAAVARYWLRTEEEEAAERAKATLRAEKEAAKYRQEPSSPGSETTPEIDCRVQVAAKQPGSTINAKEDLAVKLSDTAVPDTGPAVPERGDAKSVTCALSRQEALEEFDVLSKVRQELARIKEEMSRNQDALGKSVEMPVARESVRAGNARNRKVKMRPLVFPYTYEWLSGREDLLGRNAQ